MDLAVVSVCFVCVNGVEMLDEKYREKRGKTDAHAP
jgi:hypothetical protein